MSAIRNAIMQEHDLKIEAIEAIEALVVAVSPSNVIGSQGRLPWHIPADLKRFRKLTLQHSVIMGRKTWDEIYDRLGTALPQRRNVVLTSRPLPQASSELGSEVIAVGSVEAAMQQSCGHAMVIGGAQIYQAFLPFANKIYMTRIFADYSGDAFFPELNMDEWDEEELERFDTYAFSTLRRRQTSS